MFLYMGLFEKNTVATVLMKTTIYVFFFIFQTLKDAPYISQELNWSFFGSYDTMRGPSGSNFSTNSTLVKEGRYIGTLFH